MVGTSRGGTIEIALTAVHGNEVERPVGQEVVALTAFEADGKTRAAHGRRRYEEGQQQQIN